MFIGKHGVGKTALVKAAFERNGLRWKYFSASTMDPWVDLVGVPKERTEDNITYLDLVRPKEFQKDEIDAIFLDELNRSGKKVRNSCMELLQFKSINGKKYNSLRLIWAAINPQDDETYDVERLDPAHEDRFHIKVSVPYKPDRVYFIKNYGEDIGRSALAWWDGLPNDQKDLVSPRRLDYALNVFQNSGDMRYVLPESSNVSKFITTLKNGPISDMLQKYQENNDTIAARAFLAQENNYAAAVDWLIKKRDRLAFFLPTLPLEKISNLIASQKLALEVALDLSLINQDIKNIISNILSVNQNRTLINKIRKEIKNNKVLGELFYGIKATVAYNVGVNPEKPFFNTNPPPNYKQTIDNCFNTIKTKGYMSTVERKRLYKTISAAIPAKLTTAEAVTTLEFLNAVSIHSQYITLIKLKNLMGVVNHCIDQINKNDFINFAGIETQYKTNIRNLLWKIKADKTLGEKLYCPV